MSLTAQQIFAEKIAHRIQENSKKAADINAIYEFQITGEEPSVWTIDLTQAEGKVVQQESNQAQCTVTISLSDLSDIVEKKLNPQMAFMTGKLKVKGDMGLALKLGTIL